MHRSLSAPGKLFLAGEYAVLWGGVARIAAVGPRTGALVGRRPDPGVHLLLDAGRLRGHATPLGAHWQDEVTAPYRFAACAVNLALRTVHSATVGFDLALAPAPKSPQGEKLGLGGSACACLLATESARYVLEQKWDPLKLALLAHSQAQNGKGSGGDVAAIFAGGVIRYARYDVSALERAALGGQLGAALLSAPAVEVLRLPTPRVSLGYVSTGGAASTPDQILRVEARLDPDERSRFVAASDAAGAQLESALLQGDFTQLNEATQTLQHLLTTLSPVVETEPMQRALAIARAYGSAGKVSGAGGGDGCILFSPNPESREDLLKGLSSRGFFAMPLELEPGLRGEVEPDAQLSRWLAV